MISWPQQRARERSELAIMVGCVVVMLVSLSICVSNYLRVQRDDQAEAAANANIQGGNIMIAWQREKEIPRMRAIATDLVMSDAHQAFGPGRAATLLDIAVQPVDSRSYSVDVTFDIADTEPHGAGEMHAARKYLILQKDGTWKLYARNAWQAESA